MGCQPAQGTWCGVTVSCRGEAEAGTKQKDKLDARCRELQTQMREQQVGCSSAVAVGCCPAFDRPSVLALCCKLVVTPYVCDCCRLKLTPCYVSTR